MKSNVLKHNQRPILNEIPLEGGTIFKPGVIVTMSTGQWDGMLEAAYDNGTILLELDGDEMPIKAYQRKTEKDD